MSQKAVDSKDNPGRLRKISTRSQKGNSANDIAEVFKKQMADSKSKGKISANKLSQKQKNNTAELEKTKENIRNLIKNLEPEEEASKENVTTNVNAQSAEHDKALQSSRKLRSNNEEIDAHECSQESNIGFSDLSDLNNSVESIELREQNEQEQVEECINASIQQRSEDAQNAHDTDNMSLDQINSANPSNAEILEGLKELCQLVKKLDNDIHHPKNGVGAKLVQLTLRCDNLYTDIHGAVSGILPTLDTMSENISKNQTNLETVQQHQSKITQMMSDMKKLTHDIEVMKNLFQKHSQKLKSVEKGMLDLTCRGMEQNLVFHGICEIDPKEGAPENCKHTIQQFVAEKLGVEIEVKDIWKAHRSGVKKEDRARVIVTKLAYEAKEAIMSNVTKLKAMKNRHEQKIFVNEQIPEGITETRKQVQARVKTLKKANENLPVSAQKRIQVLNDKVLVDGQLNNPEVQPPEPADLFMNAVELKMVKALGSKIKEAKPINNKNSNFVGLAVKVHTIEEVNRAYKAVALRYPSVDHIMVAYGLKEQDQIKTGFCDDSEYGGGQRIAQILKQHKVRDTAVFVV